MKKLIGLAVLPLLAHSLYAAQSPVRTLSFEERVKAQQAIEQVYWNHRLWPKENPREKPPLSTVMPEDVVRAKVEDYLKKSNALEALWKRPITDDQLQAEVDRMAQGSRAPDVLREVFEALGNEPFVIAETLARQTLAERFLRKAYAYDERFHGDQKRKAEAARTACQRPECMESMGGVYRETTWRLRGPVSDSSDEPPNDRVLRLDTGDWEDLLERLSKKRSGTPRSLPVRELSALEETAEGFAVNAVLVQDDDEITIATVVWTKNPFDAWWAAERVALTADVGGYARTFELPTTIQSGCVFDTWTTPSTTATPALRYSHTAVWTGAEMIVWGGYGVSSRVNSGDRYDPATDTWVATSTGTNVPSARLGHTAVWTGTKMVVWGGDNGSTPVNTGGRYDPSTNSWLETSTGTNVPSARDLHTAVWTGTEMIVWGGAASLSSGGRYDPSTNTWLATSTGANVPSGRYDHSAVWTGTQMIVWGGWSLGYANTGGRYDPSSNTWAATSTGVGVPSARSEHSAVWTGTEMIVWGGESISLGMVVNTGGRYDPSANAWLATSIGANVPTARVSHTAVWTGNEMIVWGGSGFTNTGGRYAPSTDTWAPTSTGANVPSARRAHTAVWVAPQMIIWGGDPSTLIGGLYCGLCVSPVTWYQDQDGDGYGISEVTQLACTQPAGFAAVTGDCDDASAAIHPGGVEACNGVDDDCDDVADDGVTPPPDSPDVHAVGADELAWLPIPAATTYDVVSGSLLLLLASGDFSQAAAACLRADQADASVTASGVPDAGDGFWYLVRGGNCGGNGSYDTGSPAQAASRDAALAQSPNACP